MPAKSTLKRSQAIDLRRRLEEFIGHTGLSVTDVARCTGMTWAGIHYLRSGRRRPNVDSFNTLDTFMGDYLRSHPDGEKIERDGQNHNEIETEGAARCALPGNFVMTDSARVVINALDYCAKRHINGAIFADPGFGKSEAMRYWSATTKYAHTVIFCRAYTCYTKLLRGLARATGLDGFATSTDLDEVLHEELTSRPRLVIVDEADMLNTRTLDWLRTLWDESGHRTSFMLLAKPAFYQRLQVAHARSHQDLRQVWRRLAFRKFLTGISFGDLMAYLKLRGLADKLDEEAARVLHAACAGSFGDLDMLCELIQQMLDENPRLQGRITVALVEKAREVRFGADIVRRRA